MNPCKAYPNPGALCHHLELIVGIQDVDSLGHLNNVAYVAYLERGRLDFYHHIGLALDSPRAPRRGTVVVHLDINFRAECFAGDALCILTRAHSRGRRSYVLEQSITRDPHGIVCDARVTNVIMDLDQRTVVDIPDPLSRLFQS